MKLIRDTLPVMSCGLRCDEQNANDSKLHECDCNFFCFRFFRDAAVVELGHGGSGWALDGGGRLLDIGICRCAAVHRLNAHE